MSDHYILKDRRPVPVDLMTWARAFERSDQRRVAQDTVGSVRVSTVFLGLNHRFGDEGPPLIFETMIFGGWHDQYQERFSTWEEAEAGHAKALRLVRLLRWIPKDFQQSVHTIIGEVVSWWHGVQYRRRQRRSQRTGADTP